MLKILIAKHLLKEESLAMRFRKEIEKRLWDEQKSRVRYNSVKDGYMARQQAEEYAKEIRQVKWNKWTERVLRWFIITCIVMIYHLFVGALAIHIYQ